MEILDEETKAILIGTTLGDGYLERHGRGVRLQVVHSIRYREYVEWKHKQLAAIGSSPIHYCNAKYPFWRFVTKIHPYLTELRDMFYQGVIRGVPENIAELLKSPLALAVWFMDDATRGNGKYPYVKFETQRLTKKDIACLQDCLLRNFSIESSIHRSGRNRGLRLYIPSKSARRLGDLIEPYLGTCMRYKLPYPRND